MSWGLGWKRPSEIFHLTLYYGTEAPAEYPDRTSSSSSASFTSASSSSSIHDHLVHHDLLGFRVELDWTSGEDEDQLALRLQSQLMVALPSPQDFVTLHLTEGDAGNVAVDMLVVKRREPLNAVILSKAPGSGQQADGVGVLTRLISFNFSPSDSSPPPLGEGVPGPGCAEHWKSMTMLSLCGCSLAAFPVELTKLPLLEKLYLNNNKLQALPSELGDLKNLKVLSVDYNMLVSVPVELRQCVSWLSCLLNTTSLSDPSWISGLWLNFEFLDFLVTRWSFYLKFCHCTTSGTYLLQILGLWLMSI